MSARSLARRARVALVLASLAASSAAAQPFTSTTFFGDSFTDTGNGDVLSLMLLGTDLTPSPPYAPGRASNGALWADYLATALGHPADANASLLGGRDFAIGTARTGTTGAGGAPVGMLSQLGLPGATVTDPTGLYVLFGGSNDIFDAASLATPAQQLAALNTAVGNLATLATTLYGAGARRFLVPNVPNVGLAPLALNTPASPLLGALSSQFNALLQTRLALLGATLPGSTFFGLHLDTLFEDILADAAQGGTRYGLTNTTTPCLDGFAPPGAPSCAVSVFADTEHPTTAAHALIAAAAYQRVVNGVDVSAVPEPATSVLLGSGVCVLGVLARRRRSVGTV